MLEMVGDGLLTWKLRLRSKLSFLRVMCWLVLAILDSSASSAIAESAADQEPKGLAFVKSLVTQMRPQHGEIPGNPSDWDISRFGGVWQTYLIGGRLIFFLFASKEGALFDPSTGYIKSVDQKLGYRIYKTALNDQWPSGSLSVFAWHELPGLVTMTSGGPEGGSSNDCSTPLTTYYTVSDTKTGSERSFYVVEGHRSPITLVAHPCVEAQPVKAVTYRTTVADVIPSFIPTPNRDLYIYTREPAALIKLDSHFHSAPSLLQGLFLIDKDLVYNALAGQANVLAGQANISLALRVVTFENIIDRIKHEER